MVPDDGEFADEALVRAAQAGSLAAFETLVRRYQGRVQQFLLKVCGDASDAQEVTQDAFVRAYEAIGQFDPARPFAPWLFTIARRRCIDRHRASPPPPSEGSLWEPLDEDDPSRQAVRAEDGQRLWLLARQCLGALQFQAMWLRYASDFSVAETAQILGRTQTHVKVLLFRARQRLLFELERTDANSLVPWGNELRESLGIKQPAPAIGDANAAPNQGKQVDSPVFARHLPDNQAHP